MPTSILLVDDHPVFRKGLRILFEDEQDIQVVGEAGDGQEAIDQVKKLSPDVVVMDINMPNLDGIEATREIIAEAPETRVVALSVHSGKQFVRDMIKAGASGYILKESIPEEMVAGIRTVLAGDIYLSQSVSKVLVSDYKTLAPDSDPAGGVRPKTILYTKLHRPGISASIIPRSRLITALENGVHNPLTLVAAPAGYGKSILVSQWLEVSQLPSAWVSLDDGDNQLRMFLTYLITAICDVVEGAEIKTRALVMGGQLPSAKEACQHLLNDLESCGRKFALVLDDYHQIRNESIHEFITELLVHPSPSIHLVMVTRRDPPLPLTSLRARGMLTEITQTDLRFTVAETKAYLERFLRLSVSDQTAQIIEEKIELPAGYNLIWSGQYEYMQAAAAKLKVVIPLTLLIIFVIIYINTKSMIKTGIIFVALPLSLVGCFWYIYLLGYNMSIAVWVGIIALAGISAETGVGIRLLLQIFERLMPNPTEVNPPIFLKGEGADAEEVKVSPDPDAHAIAHVFMVNVDPFKGRLALFRIHQGTIRTGNQLFVGDHRKPAVEVGAQPCPARLEVPAGKDAGSIGPPMGGRGRPREGARA